MVISMNIKKILVGVVIYSVIGTSALWAGGHQSKGEVNQPNGEWLAETVDGTAAADETNHTISFADDGTISGHTGCNAYSGKAAIDGDKMVLSDVAETTKTMCKYKIAERAAGQYLAALSKAASYKVNVNVLRLYDADGKEVIKFRRLGRSTGTIR
jgi:heat shock protein HslJ